MALDSGPSEEEKDEEEEEEKEDHHHYHHQLKIIQEHAGWSHLEALLRFHIHERSTTWNWFDSAIIWTSATLVWSWARGEIQALLILLLDVALLHLRKNQSLCNDGFERVKNRPSLAWKWVLFFQIVVVIVVVIGHTAADSIWSTKELLGSFSTVKHGLVC